MRISIPAILSTALVLSSGSALAQQPADPPPEAPPPPPAATPGPADEPQPPAAPAPAGPAQPSALEPEPPPPPPAGGAASFPEPPPGPGPVFSVESDGPPRTDAPPLAGWHNNFFLRDPDDIIRLYPQARLHLDLHSFMGEGVGDPATEGAQSLNTRFFARRARLEMSGVVLQRWSFLIGVDFGGTRAGQQVEAAGPANNFINYRVIPALNFMFGVYRAPFSMENRTGSNVTPWMERSVPIRAFASPGREIGATAWGTLFDDGLNYEIGVFGGDGQNRPQVDNRADFMGRVFVRPFAKSAREDLSKAQVGVSARHGQRDQRFVDYQHAPITTGQGVSLWDPSYTDSFGRETLVIPSGAQNAIGGELRFVLSHLDLRAEGYYVAHNTREAIAGFERTNTERLGRLRGLGWYAHASVWALGDAFVPEAVAQGRPGIFRPVQVDLARPVEKPRRGLELMALVGGIHADYSGAAREGRADALTPGAPGVASDLTVLQYSLGANYWHSRHIRGSVNYIIYHTPGSGSPDNLASVPGNRGPTPNPDAHLLHELGFRLAAQF